MHGLQKREEMVHFTILKSFSFSLVSFAIYFLYLWIDLGYLITQMSALTAVMLFDLHNRFMFSSLRLSNQRAFSDQTTWRQERCLTRNTWKQNPAAKQTRQDMWRLLIRIGGRPPNELLNHSPTLHWCFRARDWATGKRREMGRNRRRRKY